MIQGVYSSFQITPFRNLLRFFHDFVILLLFINCVNNFRFCIYLLFLHCEIFGWENFSQTLEHLAFFSNFWCISLLQENLDESGDPCESGESGKSHNSGETDEYGDSHDSGDSGESCGSGDSDKYAINMLILQIIIGE